MGQFIYADRKVTMPDEAVRGYRQLVQEILQAGHSRWINVGVKGEGSESETLSVLVSPGVQILTSVASGAEEELTEQNELWREYFPDATAAVDAAKASTAE